MFVMIVCGKIKPSTFYDTEVLLYVQQAQLDKYHQQLSLTNATENLVLIDDNSSSITTIGGFQKARGRGYTRGRGRAKARVTYCLPRKLVNKR